MGIYKDRCRFSGFVTIFATINDKTRRNSWQNPTRARRWGKNMIIDTRKHGVQFRRRRTGHVLRRNDLWVDKILDLSSISLHYAVAINPSERYATPNFLEDIRTGIRSETTTELAAAAGEDGWTAAETRPVVLLVAAGRQPSDAANL